MNTDADSTPPNRGAPWQYLVGLLLLLSPLLTPVFLLPVKDPRRREYLFFGGMGIALLEVAAIVFAVDRRAGNEGLEYRRHRGVVLCCRPAYSLCCWSGAALGEGP